MTPYHAQHADLFRSVANILARDYEAPGGTAETVAEWCDNNRGSYFVLHRDFIRLIMSIELAALIAAVEGYERRLG